MRQHATLGVGIIGCGRIARMRHLPILKKMDGVRLVAAADSNPEALSQVAGRFAIPQHYPDHSDLLQDPAVEAVLVCTPPGSHFSHARDVLCSGRHLLMDSPLALSEEECDELVGLAAGTDCVATVGFNLRHHALVQRARECIEAGWLGPVHAISAMFSTPSRGNRGDVFPAWRQPDSLDGNVFIESALQHFDSWRTLTGAEFTEVTVQCTRVGGPVSLAAKMKKGAGEFAETIVVGAVFSEYSGDNSEIRLIGRNGTIALSLYRYDGFRYCPALQVEGSVKQRLKGIAESVRALPRGFRTLSLGGEYGQTFYRQLEMFVAACREGKPAAVSMEDGRAATVASLAAFRSLTTGQKVTLGQS